MTAYLNFYLPANALALALARLPAWENDNKLETRNIAFPGISLRRLRLERLSAEYARPFIEACF
jgi:hypothetical protein